LVNEKPGARHVGEQDAKADQQGNRHNSGPLSGDFGGPGNAESDFGVLGGEQGIQTNEKGHKVAPNGVILRPGTEKSGPRIDVPANGQKPHETLHYGR
jgi:filamentous hemagglutinin